MALFLPFFAPSVNLAVWKEQVGSFIKLAPLFPPLQTIKDSYTKLSSEFSSARQLKKWKNKTKPPILTLLIMKMAEPKTAWLQIGGPAITLCLQFTRSEYKIFHTFWKEFLLLERSKTHSEWSAISYLGLRTFRLLNNALVKYLIQPFPVKRKKGKGKAYRKNISNKW